MATVPNGVSTYSGTSTSTASSITFADRYGYVLVENTGTADLYVTGDGSTPTGSGAGSGLVVPPGESVLVANGLPLWFQSSKAIPHGQPVNAQGTGTTSASNPAIEQPYMSSGAGQMTNPGTNITVVGASTFTLTAAG